MADVTINQLSPGSPNKNSAVIPYSDGSTTYKTSPAGIVAASPGAILQVQSTLLTKAYSASTQTLTQIPEFSVSIAPKSSSSRIMVQMCFGIVSISSSGTTQFQIYRDGTPVAVGDAAGNCIRSTFRCAQTVNPDHGVSQTMIVLDSPNTTNSVTYSVWFTTQTGMGMAINTDWSNRAGTASNNDAYRARTVSTITATEIAG